jgi:hypothetical protein
MNRPFRPIAIPPVTNEDRLPHEKAVWREGIPLGEPMRTPMSVDYGDGLIEQTTYGEANWARVQRWRWGWAP